LLDRISAFMETCCFSGERRMEQVTTRILEQSSDAIIVIRHADASVLGTNETFSAVTGQLEREVVGRPVGDLLVGLRAADGGMAVDAWRDTGSTTDVPAALWTRSGDLRVGQLSVLELEVEGQRIAVCAIRDTRDPTQEERRLVARHELHRLERSGGVWPDTAVGALEAVGKCLRWQFGAFWSPDTESTSLRCTAVWREAAPHLRELEEVSWRVGFEPGDGLLGRVWLSREAAWAADASSDPDLRRRCGGVAMAMHGWLGFPAWGSDGVVGVVEFISVEPRQPSEEPLELAAEFGPLFGRLVQGVRAEPANLPSEPAAGLPDRSESPHDTVSDALRDLMGAVGAMTGALERHPVSLAQVEPPAFLEELAAGMGKLTRLLEHTTGQDADAGLPREPASSAAPPTRLPTGLTLKAVSQRTGIPAATLRTWQRRYGFMQPTRSPSGYRLYGEDEVTLIQQVKYLRDQGVRIGEAMAAVISTGGRPEPGARDEPVGGGSQPR
jgi:PAS domain S-box-containing protein